MATIPLYPYGYKLSLKGKKEVDESRAAVVRLIYKKYLEGTNRYQITWHLVENRILRPRGDSCDWHYSMVNKILMDGRYAGDDKYPPILSDEIFCAALAKRKDEKEKYVSNLIDSCNSKRVYPFSGFIICESCGSKYIRGIQHKNAYVKKATWRCRNYKLKSEGKCNSSGNIYEEILEDACVKAYNKVQRQCMSGNFQLRRDSKPPDSVNPSLETLINETLDQMKSADESRLSILQNDLNILIARRTAMDWGAAPLDLSGFETEKILKHYKDNPEPMETFEDVKFKFVFSSISAQEPGKLKFILKNGNEILQEYKPMRGQINNAKNIEVIPARQLKEIKGLEATAKTRVCAYCRVSTDNEDQLSSFDAQINFYTAKISSNPEWEFVGIYADEGISATNTKKRVEFNKMIDDCMNGKIDLVMTKSISRFARNTLDCLRYVRLLKVNHKWFLGYTKDENGDLVIDPEQAKTVRRIYREFPWGEKRLQYY